MVRNKLSRAEKLERRVERKFKKLKLREEIKQKYGVFTQKMLEDLFEKTLSLKLASFLGKINEIFASKEDLKELTTKGDLRKLDGKLDWLVSSYKKFEEEHTLLSKQTSEQGDRIETIEKRLGIAIQ